MRIVCYIYYVERGNFSDEFLRLWFTIRILLESSVPLEGDLLLDWNHCSIAVFS